MDEKLNTETRHGNGKKETAKFTQFCHGVDSRVRWQSGNDAQKI
jgi:hypothetical protein